MRCSYSIRKMTEHMIKIPSIRADEEPRRIVWNDGNGKVRGNHSGIQFILSVIEAAPIHCGVGGRIWHLEDPGRRSEEFLVLLYMIDCRILHQESLHTTLPAVFHGVELPLEEKAEDL